MASIVDKLERDRPLFHDDFKGGLISWNANFHLLRFIEGHLVPGMQTLETGSGYSTVVFIAKGCFHTSITPYRSELDRIMVYCKENNLSLNHADFIANNSANHLPLIQNKELDFFFIDGAHRFPFPIIDWFYGSRLLKQGGLLVVDDTDIISCFLLSKFLESDAHWEQVLIENAFAVFKKIGGHDYPSDWWGQNFGRNKIDGEKTFINIFFAQPGRVQNKSNGDIPAGMTRKSVPSEEKTGTSALRSANGLLNGGLNTEYEEHPVSVMEEVRIDWTPAFNYKKLTEQEVDEFSNIEVTKDLLLGGVHAQKSWGYWYRYLAEQVWKTNLCKEIVEFCNSIENPKILSLGCGFGGMELEIAALLKKPYDIVAVDINKNIFAQAIKKTRKDDLHIQFIPLDLNFIKIRQDSFDAIFAHASLHHVLNLEHLLYQIYRGVKRHGRFIMLDMIGKNQALFWKENVDFARYIVRTMPAQYTRKISDRENIIAPYSEPSDQKGMEGIRQEEIERQIYNYFDPLKVFKYNSFIRMICTHPVIGKRIDPDKQQDRKYLEKLFSLDLQQIEDRNLRATEMFGVFTKKELMSIDSINAEAHSYLGAHYARQGMQEHALRHRKAALQLDQNNQAAMHHIAAMEQGKNETETIVQASSERALDRPAPAFHRSLISCAGERKNALQMSVIICTYNRATLLSMALESLTLQTLDKGSYEVIVIDDGSSDSTRQIVDSFVGKLPIKYFYQKNAGLAAAKNHGIYTSQGKILFFSDDDDIATPTLLEEHIETHQMYPQEHYAVLNYTTWGPDLLITPLMHFITEVQYFLFFYPNLKHGEILDYTYFWGGRSSCKRSFLINFGVFNPVFHFGCEDIELGYRLSKFNFKVVYNSHAISYMVRPVTFDEFCQRLIKQGRSQSVFSRLHNNPEVHKWAEVLNAESTWSKISPIYEAKVRSARELDKIAALKLHHKLDIDDSTMRLLYASYLWAFKASKIKGIMISKEESQSH